MKSLHQNPLLPLYYLLFSLFVFANCNRQAAEAIESLNLPSLTPNILIDDTQYLAGPCEPSIFVSPVDQNYVVAGAVLDQVYFSQNGGKTWSAKKMKSKYGVYGDPVITCDYNGNFFYAHLSNPTGLAFISDEFLDRIVIQKSTDNGKSWNDAGFAGTHFTKDQDKHWLAVDPKDNTLYITWTEFDEYNSRAIEDKSRILFSKSTDGGITWAEEITLSQLEGNCLDDDYTTEGAVPAVGINGEVFVAWSYGEKIYFDRSSDKGKTWLKEDIVIADQPGGWTFDIPGIFRCNGMPITAVDLSESPNRGTIYVNWSDQKNGENDTDVWLSKSTDGGTTWSSPLRVNNDPPGKHQFFTWMAVDPTSGNIYIVFYDRRNYNDTQTDVYLAVSNDSGMTFTNQKISDKPFKPNKGVFFGDYNNISAYNGIVRPIWTRADGNKLSVWTALVDMKH